MSTRAPVGRVAVDLASSGAHSTRQGNRRPPRQDPLRAPAGAECPTANVLKSPPSGSSSSSSAIWATSSPGSAAARSSAESRLRELESEEAQPRRRRSSASSVERVTELEHENAVAPWPARGGHRAHQARCSSACDSSGSRRRGRSDERQEDVDQGRDPRRVVRDPERGGAGAHAGRRRAPRPGDPADPRLGRR